MCTNNWQQIVLLQKFTTCIVAERENQRIKSRGYKWCHSNSSPSNIRRDQQAVDAAKHNCVLKNILRDDVFAECTRYSKRILTLKKQKKFQANAQTWDFHKCIENATLFTYLQTSTLSCWRIRGIRSLIHVSESSMKPYWSGDPTQLDAGNSFSKVDKSIKTFHES